MESAAPEAVKTAATQSSPAKPVKTAACSGQPSTSEAVETAPAKTTTASRVETAPSAAEAASTARDSWCYSKGQGQQYRAELTYSPHTDLPQESRSVLLLFSR